MEKFEDLKRRFSLSNVTESQKLELIQLMQQNLKIRNGQNSATIKCLDGKEHCITSDNVEDLYAIAATLDYNEKNKKQPILPVMHVKKHWGRINTVQTIHIQ